MKKKILLISLLSGFVFLATLTMVFLLFSEPSSTNQNNNSSSSSNSSVTSILKENSAFGKIMNVDGSECDEITPNPKLTVLPMNKEDVGAFIPLGLMVEAHVTPIDHAYFSPKDFKSKDRYQYKVYAAADATLLNIQRRNRSVSDSPDKFTDDYRLIFQISCTYGYYYDLVTKLDETLVAKLPTLDEMSSTNVSIEVKAGDLIGYVGTQTLDFATYDSNLTLSGFLNPETYIREPWKIHTADPILSFSEELQVEIQKLNLRNTFPYGGKIDYDQKGKLVGNYFKTGTKGYEGTNKERYWEGHLSFAYDHIDPKFLIISIGDYSGKSKQFSVKENLPDFAEIDINNGIVKYELTNKEYIRKNGLPLTPGTPYPDITLQKNQEVLGTVLVQVVDDNSIKFEVFPSKKKTQVSAFTSNASIYVR